MRVQHNIAAMNAYRNFGVNNKGLNKNLEKLSSGYKINRAGDDAAGLAVSEKMRAQISATDGAIKNVKDGISMIQTAEGALTEVNDMLNRMYTLAEQAANGIYEDKDRLNLDMEVQQLKTEIDRIGSTANFNGKKLFSASENIFTGNTSFAIDDMGRAGTDGMLTLTWDDDTGMDKTIAAGFDDIAAGLSSENLKLGEPSDASGTNVQTAASAQTAMTTIKDAIDAVSAVRGKLGAYQNRLEHTANNLGVMKENMQDAESTIRDTDVAEEMMKYTKNNIMNQAAQAMLAQANQQPQGVLQLLQ